ncbi:dynamin family protein [Thioalkalivibrio nitratireducens DSM 14787]|uniref:Dynamin family protein n=1 Tax=Thioalkalivibrio nitratireducens (strain DSM 14787 / UNIQEM 213 / ALEN2) TaxID=1255043 RepID=L0E003_THIND|nr:dynamin family protein [Thioalkalivibrio nitratireducens]AGA34577.1 dynamin family protein [Thioalkalivibrio nitratireducens DSM 14787]
MFNRPGNRVSQQLSRLSKRLSEENPALEGVVTPFQALDRVGYAAGLLDPEEESYAFTISWWPMIAVLGTFSAGKSTFVNEYIGTTVQRSGSQAVDDRFTVISYGTSDKVQELPGLALDGDPRFPFYRVSDEIERLSDGGGRTVDHFLAMKTVRSERLRGRILIDSPGFDADEQRATILQLTDHIIDLSDLVLVFFDARHPEPGAMRDTLEHLVNRVAARNDFTKLVFILNQIDTTWREDNLEEVVSAWQRAVVRQGTATGRFYCLYNPSAAVEIGDEKVRARYEYKSARDREEIHHKIAEISSSRSYRIVGAMQAIAESIEMDALPALTRALGRWRRRVVQANALMMGVVLVAGVWVGQSLTGGFAPWFDGTLTQGMREHPVISSLVVVLLAGLLLGIHFFNRGWVARRVARTLPNETASGNWRAAFFRNTAFWRSIFLRAPAGLGRGAIRQLHALREQAETYVQRLNDQFMDEGHPASTAESADASAPSGQRRNTESSVGGHAARTDAAG